MSIVIGEKGALSFDDTWDDDKQDIKLGVSMVGSSGFSVDTYIDKIDAIAIVNLLVDMFNIEGEQ